MDFTGTKVECQSPNEKQAYVLLYLVCKAGEKMEMLLFIFFSLLAHACPVRSQQLPPKNIFILAGQSNMAGRGGVNDNNSDWDGVVPRKCQPNPSILRLSASLTWVEAHEPLHADIDTKKTNGIGPGMAFANTVLTKDSTFGVIGLVPCAVGGTTISEWKRGSFLYKQMVKRAQASVRDGGTIQALLWYQGESDTESKGDAESYQGKLQRFFMDIREDLQSPMLPIIQVALASGSGPFVKIVREAQLGIDLLDLQTVDAEGLPLEPDSLHLSTTAQVRLGGMLADTFLKQLPKSVPICTPIKSSAPRRCFNFVLDILIVPLLGCILTFL